MKVSQRQLEALEIIRFNPGIRPREFAKKFWPNADGFRRHTRCGHGVTRGGGMRLAAGGYLGKLRHAGLIHWAVVNNHDGYALTDKGRTLYEQTPKEQGQ